MESSLLIAAGRPDTPATHPATRPAATQEKYPPARLAAACRQQGLALGRRLDDTFTVTVHPPFVVAGNMPAERLKGYANGSVLRPAGAMWAGYFRKRPDKVITVLLFADGKSYRKWAERLFGDRKVPYFGYYKPASRTLVMNIATGTGTLVHELTHALIVYDFADVPTWFNEGLASLHEQCNVGESVITGLVNWRLPALQKAIRDGKLRPLSDLVTKRDFYSRLSGLNYAQSRYFVMYMQHRRLLKRFYAYFREHHSGAGADVKAVQHIFGKDIDAVEKNFLTWVKTLKFGR